MHSDIIRPIIVWKLVYIQSQWSTLTIRVWIFIKIMIHNPIYTSRFHLRLSDRMYISSLFLERDFILNIVCAFYIFISLFSYSYTFYFKNCFHYKYIHILHANTHIHTHVYNCWCRRSQRSANTIWFVWKLGFFLPHQRLKLC